MPATTACRAYPYPVGADRIDVANDMRKLADAIDADVCKLTTRLGFVGRHTGLAIPAGGYVAYSFNLMTNWGATFGAVGNTRFTVPAGVEGIYSISCSVRALGGIDVGFADVAINVGGDVNQMITASYIPQTKQRAGVAVTVGLIPGQWMQFEQYNPGGEQFFAVDVACFRVSL